MTAPATAGEPGSSTETLRDARAALDAAAADLTRLTDELAACRVELDDLETLVDLVLGVTSTPVVVVDRSRRVTALSRAAEERLGVGLGDPLSELLAPEPAREVGELLDGDEAVDADLPGAGEGARVRMLPGGRAVLVLPTP
jgi:PAS domain-containing protein